MLITLLPTKKALRALSSNVILIGSYSTVKIFSIVDPLLSDIFFSFSKKRSKRKPVPPCLLHSHLRSLASLRGAQVDMLGGETISDIISR